MQFQFDEVTLDTDGGIVEVRGERLHLPPRLLATLQALVERHDRVVSREELKRVVWPDTHVEDNSVTQAVKAVRSALAGTVAADRLRTVPRRGYCFAGPVVVIPPADTPDGLTSVEPGRPAATRWTPLALAAFSLILGAGLATLTLSEFGRAGSDRPDRSATLYKEGAELLATRRADDLRQAADRFSAAVAAEPGHYEALTALAQSRYLLGFYGVADPDTLRLAREAADEAIRVDPSRAAAYAVRASIALDSRWDLAGSARDFAQALRLDPHDSLTRHWAAWWCLAAGRLGDARALLDSAVRLEPLSAMVLTARATFAYLDGDLAAAEVDARRALTIDPDFFRAELRLGLVHLAAGRAEAALASLERARDIAPDVPETTAALAHALAVLRQPDRARTLLDRSPGLTEYDRAIVLTGLERYSEALEALTSARRHGQLFPGLFAYEPRLAPLHGFREFEALQSSFSTAKAALPTVARGGAVPVRALWATLAHQPARSGSAEPR